MTNARRDVQRLDALERENEQLRFALSSRILIEQAKGILAERLDLDVDTAFILLRHASRSSQMRLHDLAAAVTRTRETPTEIEKAVPRFREINASIPRRAGARTDA
jgi:AmiR/NasT family two-component response regulator